MRPEEPAEIVPGRPPDRTGAAPLAAEPRSAGLRPGDRERPGHQGSGHETAEPAPPSAGASAYTGEEPDYRFSLANERTFLAYIRTALALLAGGVAVVQLIPSFGVSSGRQILGLALTGLSILVAATSYSRWADNEEAMRLGRRLPRSRVPQVVGWGLSAISIVALVLLVVDAIRRHR